MLETCMPIIPGGERRKRGCNRENLRIQGRRKVRREHVPGRPAPGKKKKKKEKGLTSDLGQLAVWEKEKASKNWAAILLPAHREKKKGDGPLREREPPSGKKAGNLTVPPKPMEKKKKKGQRAAALGSGREKKRGEGANRRCLDMLSGR